jgi:DNA-binding transcriptional LysR family regulator
MERRFANLPGSLNALVVLESAVRHASFTGASRELGLTQPSVSRHISGLEDRIGQPLFERQNNRIKPTAAGRKLADAVYLGFGHVETTMQDLAPSRSDEGIVLACSFGFADQWLLPRFSDLQDALGGTRIRMATSDWPEALDMTRVDAAIVSDLTGAPDRRSIQLFEEEAFPVCSPDYLRRHPQLTGSPMALLDAGLLHFDVGASGFLTWETWFARNGLNLPLRPDRKIFDAYPFLTRAAQDGAGVALGWRHLVDRMIDDGSLVKIGPAIRNRPAAYYLQYRETIRLKSELDKLVAWFRRRIDDRPPPDRNPD